MTKLIIYRFWISNKIGEKQILNHFNGEDDLLNVGNDFCKHIHKNIKSYTDNTGNKRTFTLDSLQKLDENGRSIYGYFDSALTGDRLKIKDGETNLLKLDVDLKDLQSRNFFFLFYIPKGSKHGYLIIQKKSNHGVKNILENTFNQFLQMKGFNDYRFCLDFAQNLNQLAEMLDFGELKEINLTENKIKTDFQCQLNELEGIECDGTYEKSIKFSSKSNVNEYKRVLYNLYKTNFRDYEKINVLGQEFDEVSFIIHHNSVSKTFYVKNKSKTRSDIDITKYLDYVNGEPTIKSLVTTSWKLISEDIIPEIDNEDLIAS